jgi:hypothetical protein
MRAQVRRRGTRIEQAGAQATGQIGIGRAVCPCPPSLLWLRREGKTPLRIQPYHEIPTPERNGVGG